jgi:inorganic pyrophosphatase
VQALSPKTTRGDGDPLDICVVTERPLARSEMILTARVIGGLQGIDGGEADDKIIAILEKDEVWCDIDDVARLPAALVERLRHYFSTYKMVPGHDAQMYIEQIYGREHALQVVTAAMADYEEEYGS